MKNILGFGAIFTALSINSLANPNLDLLDKSEWKSECRKIVNEGGKEIKNQPYVRIQSVYSSKGDQLFWWVKSFTDEECKKIFDVIKNTLFCKGSAKDEFAQCRQTSRELSKDEKVWKMEPVIDHAGYPNPITTRVKVERLTDRKVKLYMPGESEEGPSEVLTR